MAKRGHVIALVDNQHRETTDNIEACHKRNEGQEEEGKEFFDLHHIESALLLLVAVHDFE